MLRCTKIVYAMNKMSERERERERERAHIWFKRWLNNTLL